MPLLQGTSAFALASELSNVVFSYDVQPVRNAIAYHHRATEAELQALIPNIFFRCENILHGSRNDLFLLLSSDLIVMDTLHFPETQPFEYEVLEVLRQNDWRGLLVLDDIHYNKEMERFWESIRVAKYDLTDIGHGSGTGVVDFGGQLNIEG
jgi:hypothetical protein